MGEESEDKKSCGGPGEQCLGSWTYAQASENKLGIGGGHSRGVTPKIASDESEEHPRHFSTGTLHLEHLCSQSAVFILQRRVPLGGKVFDPEVY